MVKCSCGQTVETAEIMTMMMMAAAATETAAAAAAAVLGMCSGSPNSNRVTTTFQFRSRCSKIGLQPPPVNTQAREGRADDDDDGSTTAAAVADYLFNPCFEINWFGGEQLHDYYCLPSAAPFPAGSRWISTHTYYAGGPI